MPDRLTPQKHAEAHRVSSRQRQLDGPRLAVQCDRGLDYRPKLGLPTRVADPPSRRERQLDGDGWMGRPLLWMNGEPNVDHVITHDFHKIERVK